jgi:hypothetical protein
MRSCSNTVRAAKTWKTSLPPGVTQRPPLPAAPPSRLANEGVSHLGRLPQYMSWEPSPPGASHRCSRRPCHSRATWSGHERYQAERSHDGLQAAGDAITDVPDRGRCRSVLLRSGRVAVDGLGAAARIGPPAHPPGNRSGQALGRPPGFHEQAATGRPALDPPADVTAPTQDHLTITHGSPFQRREKPRGDAARRGVTTPTAHLVTGTNLPRRQAVGLGSLQYVIASKDSSTSWAGPSPTTAAPGEAKRTNRAEGRSFLQPSAPVLHRWVVAEGAGPLWAATGR